MRQAIQFLTVFPIPAPQGPLGRAAWAFPFVGAMLGLIAAACVTKGGPLGPILALIALALITGGLHEDGLADIFDAVRAGRTRERMHAILKDSRIGSHGALALIGCFALRWQALGLLQGDAWMRVPAALGIARGMMVLLAASAAPAGEGLGREFITSLPRLAPVLVALQLIALAALAGSIWPAVALVAGNGILLLILRQWFVARLGGITGDCLGATCQMSEALSLGILTCL
jgi:adenosylcobinamide-GDP ribazoletransferase